MPDNNMHASLNSSKLKQKVNPTQEQSLTQTLFFHTFTVNQTLNNELFLQL